MFVRPSFATIAGPNVAAIAGTILTIPKGSTVTPPTLNVGFPQLTIVDGSPKVSYSNPRASAINFAP